MKKLATLFLLCLFVFQSTNSFWIVASFYANQDYIAENICINRFDKIPVCKGKCFLSEQLKQSEKKEQKVPNVKDKETQLYFHTIAVAFIARKKPVEVTQLPSVGSSTTITQPFFYSIFHPPRTA